jgi:hypothetical protein
MPVSSRSSRTPCGVSTISVGRVGGNGRPTLGAELRGLP